VTNQTSQLRSHDYQIIALFYLVSETGTSFFRTSFAYQFLVCLSLAILCKCVLVASRLGRRPKRLKEMQLAAAAAAVSGGGNLSAPSGPSSSDHLEMSSAAMRRLCMSSSTVNSSLDVADVHAELQVLYCYSASMAVTVNITHGIVLIVIAVCCCRHSHS